MKKSRVFIVISIIITLFIFSSSLKDASSSSETSGRVMSFINSFLNIIGFEISHAMVRKLAHFTEFSALGVSLSLSGYFSSKGLKINSAKILTSGLLICACDELLQFIPVGRSPMVLDALLDFFGILTGYLLVFMCHTLNEKRRKNIE